MDAGDISQEPLAGSVCALQFGLALGGVSHIINNGCRSDINTIFLDITWNSLLSGVR